MQIEDLRHHPIVRVIHRASFLGAAAIITLALTAILSFLANRREDHAVLRIRDHVKIAREAYIYAVERDDLLRGLVISHDPAGTSRDAALRDSMNTTLDSLAERLIPGSRADTLVRMARARIDVWERLFVRPVLGGNPPPPAADLVLFSRVREAFAALGTTLDAAYNRAVRGGDTLRLMSALLILVQLSIILWGIRLARWRLNRAAKYIIDSQNEIACRLGDAAEFRDYETSQHAQRVGDLSADIARELGWDAHQVDLIRRAAPLHDVGKIGIPDDILLKPGHLTGPEFELMRAHTRIGANILSHAHSEIIRMAGEIALEHHEHWDGAGYPLGKSHQDIPLSARIVAVADVFDALTSDRPYHSAWTREAALAELTRLRGSHLDPVVVDAFFRTRNYGPR